MSAYVLRGMGAAILASTVAVGCAQAPVLPAPTPPATTVAPTARTPAPPKVERSSARPDATPGAEDVVFRAMLAAIGDHRPWFRFDLQADRVDGDWTLDGDVDDGRGPGRLYVVVTERPGMLTANPCFDRQFVQGASCDRRFLPTGGQLFLRGPVDANGTVTVVVSLVRQDRSGVTAEAGNFSLPPFDGPLVGGQNSAPTPTRDQPVYSVEELAQLVVAIDARLDDAPSR